jgi:hypothetical protein
VDLDAPCRIDPGAVAAVITCHLRYVLDPARIREFEHGYLLPSEGASNIALASFSFPSLAAYEEFRTRALTDPECQAAFKYAEETRCFFSYERSFFRPMFG